METVTIKRATVTYDAYNNPIPGQLAVIGTFEAQIANLQSDEPILLGRSPVEVNYNIYARGVATGVLSTDTLTVRGEDVPVDGRIAPWQNKAGEHKGDHIQVRLTVG